MKNPEGEKSPKKERWPSTVSVAILLSNLPAEEVQNPYKELVLVRKRDTGQWGPIAGGILEGEHLEDTTWRELGEETNLGKEEVDIDFRFPELLLIPSGEKTSLGIVVEARVKTKIPSEGYEPDSPETDLIKPFAIDELLQLRRKQEEIFKPGYNLKVIDEWLWRYLSLKYAFEGVEFARDIARDLGLHIEE